MMGPAQTTMRYASRMRALLPAALACGPCLVVTASSCDTRPVEIIGPLPPVPDGAAPCPTTLAERLSVVKIPVDANIAWQKLGYDHFPADERVALAVQPDGQAQIAWMQVNPTIGAAPLGVHVTFLDGSLVPRAGTSDVFMPTGQEVAGLVAHDDGFALLTRDVNDGTPLAVDDADTLAYLVRWRNGAEAWKEALTGSLSEDAAPTRTLYSPFLEGQLVWNGSTYGAYFAVRGGEGDPQRALWRDALVFRDYFGKVLWEPTDGCWNNGGIRLIPDLGKVNLTTSLSVSYPEITGLCVQQIAAAVKFTALDDDRLVSDQEVGWSGYAGARFGSLLKIAEGYLVFWLSLGPTNDHQGHDIRMARLDSSFNLVGGPTWLLRTPGVEEWNLHVAPYGTAGDRFLMTYGEIAITGVTDSDYAVYVGDFVGTHLALIDVDGTILANEIVQGVPTTANSEPVILGNGDVAWAFVNPTPDYSQTIAGPNGPGQTTLRVARVRYCQ
jgi:hypothetical protein